MVTDTVTIVDMVKITDTGNITFSLVEEWSESLDLVNYSVYALPGHTLVLPGSAVLPGTGVLTWTISDSPSDWTYVISKTFEVTEGYWVMDSIVESLTYEGVPVQPADIVLEFYHAPVDRYIYLPLIMRNG
jgi:hypothetical protein